MTAPYYLNADQQNNNQAFQHASDGLQQYFMPSSYDVETAPVYSHFAQEPVFANVPQNDQLLTVPNTLYAQSPEAGPWDPYRNGLGSVPRPNNGRPNQTPRPWPTLAVSPIVNSHGKSVPRSYSGSYGPSFDDSAYGSQEVSTGFMTSFDHLGDQSYHQGCELGWEEPCQNSVFIEQATGIAECETSTPNRDSQGSRAFVAHKKRSEYFETRFYICDVERCGRVLGFKTVNDLARHKKSTHRISMPNVGSTAETWWKCASRKCKKPDKEWPRLDNFRQHLRGSHKEEVDTQEKFDDLLHRSKFCRSSGKEDSQHTTADGVDSTRTRQASMIKRPNGELSDDDGVVGDDEQRNLVFRPKKCARRHKMCPAVSESSSTRQYPTSAGSQQLLASISEHQTLEECSPFAPLHHMVAEVGSGLSGTETGGQVSENHLSDLNLNEQSDYTAPTVVATSRSMDECFRTPSITPSIEHTTGSAEGLRGSVSDLSRDPLHVERAAGCADDHDVSFEGRKRCPFPGCSKITKHDSEMRKHTKRHTRPYGCTFPNCFKTFGSKNDWKRHENSLHFQQETWRCDHPDASDDSDKPCGRLFYDKQVMKRHLKNAHKIADAPPGRHARECERLRIGRNGQHQFWCGFHAALVPLRKTREDAWAERFLHIGEHFDAGERIEDWLCVEINKVKGKITPADRSFDRVSEERDGEEEEVEVESGEGCEAETSSSAFDELVEPNPPCAQGNLPFSPTFPWPAVRSDQSGGISPQPPLLNFDTDPWQLFDRCGAYDGACDHVLCVGSMGL
ncbi:hypothetical protein LTR50_006545 [Elasticomyces elasticus]|nr:hypothetical protein LTR50_006545 [Elasticomyces elasticus]